MTKYCAQVHNHAQCTKMHHKQSHGHKMCDSKFADALPSHVCIAYRGQRFPAAVLPARRRDYCTQNLHASQNKKTRITEREHTHMQTLYL